MDRATRVLAAAGSIRNGFTFFRRASAEPAFMRGGGTACGQAVFLLKSRKKTEVMRKGVEEMILLPFASRKLAITEHGNRHVAATPINMI